MAMLLSNMALNPIKGLKNFGNDLLRTAKGEVPLSYALRTANQRAAFNDAVKGLTGDDLTNAIRNYTFNPSSDGNWSYKRMAAGLLGGYAAVDATYRALSGGSMYRNSAGEKDFVGIPMI